MADHPSAKERDRAGYGGGFGTSEGGHGGGELDRRGDHEGGCDVADGALGAVLAGGGVVLRGSGRVGARAVLRGVGRAAHGAGAGG